MSENKKGLVSSCKKVNWTISIQAVLEKKEQFVYSELIARKYSINNKKRTIIMRI